MVSSLLGFFVVLVATSIPASEGLIRLSKNAASSAPVPLARLRAPTCTAQNDVASCCVSISFPKKTKICGSFTINKSEMKVNAALSVNDKQVVQKVLKVGKLCHPLAPLPFSACVEIYHVAINIEQRKVETCLKAGLSNLGTKDLHCIRFENGKFLTHSNISPPSF